MARILTSMGFKEKWNAQMERSRIAAAYGVHAIQKNGDYRYLPEGKFKNVVKPVAGAQAIFELGADKSRPTLTRVGAGALLAGPAGAIVGALFQKDTSRNYITVIFADGDTVIIDGPAKDEKKMRTFAERIRDLA